MWRSFEAVLNHKQKFRWPLERWKAFDSTSSEQSKRETLNILINTIYGGSTANKTRLNSLGNKTALHNFFNRAEKRKSWIKQSEMESCANENREQTIRGRKFVVAGSRKKSIKTENLIFYLDLKFAFLWSDPI